MLTSTPLRNKAEMKTPNSAYPSPPRAVDPLLQGRYVLRPVEVQFPAEEQVVPARGDGGGQLLGRGDADGDRRR